MSQFDPFFLLFFTPTSELKIPAILGRAYLNESRGLMHSLKKTGTAFYLTIAALIFCACQTPAKTSFESLQVGMDKATVVEAAGSPTKTGRWRGKDRWIYEFTDKSGVTVVREITFEEGRAIYIGPRQAPNVSADEQDRRNEEFNNSDATTQRLIEDKRDRSLGVARTSHSAKQTEDEDDDEDEIDQKLRESLYGTEPDRRREHRKRAPVFEYVP